METPEKPSVHEIVCSNITAFELANIWAGKPGLTFFESELEELTDLGRVEPLQGFYYDIGLTIDGGKVVYRYS